MSPAKRKNTTASTSPTTMPSHIDEGEQLLNKDGTRRKSRVLRRKTDHSIIERRRREKINEKLVALQNIVPACRKECQDLIERKFITPLKESEDNNDATSNPAAKRNAKRKREEDKLDKARNEMSEKIRTSMVLEKLCIISHTLDFVVKLQEENKALRALCDCQAERRASISSDVELDDHYRSAHSYENSQESRSQEHSDTTHSSAAIHRPSLSPSSSSAQESLAQDEQQQRPAKRRLHWGSDDVREASIRSDTCRHKCGATSPNEPCHRARSSSLTKVEAVHDSIEEAMTPSPPPQTQSGRGVCRLSLPCITSSSETGSCHSFCRTRHSCCREEEQGSEISSDASDDLASPPPCTLKWPAISAGGSQVGYLGRQRLPPIVNLGLPKQDSQFASALRQDTIASLYRRDLPRAPEMSASRPFRPLSLYTSHCQPPVLSSAKQ
ncbi:uncharacterized protein UTRI_10594_B [Ustilago trichophora]|uniref:BHLH domain-containing protein n=1 Tax=Ustilago trichophora TaxID=86804 RepID=A0A5C3E8Z5_9BASI|nr:uncharacterized protein UTRI_10594_B [Ustilago trichophora]